MSGSLDTDKLQREVQKMYSDVAQAAETASDAEFHFETGRELAERLGYAREDLDRVPDASIEAFAGVGYCFDLAELTPGESVLDLGSGSGMDAFVAGLHVTETGSVTGIDMTPAQVDHARTLAEMHGHCHVDFQKGYIEDLPFPAESFDAVLSNGVINLSAEKHRVFEETQRVLKPGGRLVLADIVSEEQMPERIKTDADLWAACIGGAAQIDQYTAAMTELGFEIATIRDNREYEFISDQATNACQTYGVKSISLRANSS